MLVQSVRAIGARRFVGRILILGIATTMAVVMSCFDLLTFRANAPICSFLSFSIVIKQMVVLHFDNLVIILLLIRRQIPFIPAVAPYMPYAYTANHWHQ